MIQNINLGAAANDKSGDSARSGGDKINKNFAYLEAKMDNGSSLVSETGFSLTANDLTMNVGWSWIINGVAYTNPAAVVINIPFAASGLQRIDLIVLNTSNTFTRVAGIESADNTVAPAIPANSIQATLVVITDGLVDQPTAPITGDFYVAKSEFAFNKVNGTGNKAAVSITGESASFRFPSADSLSSISVSTNAKKYLYEGKKHYIKNDRTTGTLTIFNNAGTGNYKYFFPNGLDLVLNPGEIAEFLLRTTAGNNGFWDYIGIAGGTTDISGKVDKVAGKSLILDTEITRLAGVTNQDISGKQDTLVSGTNIRTVNGQTLLGSTDLVISAGAADPAQITITTTVSITTDTLGNLGKTQKEKNVIIDNGVNAINITVNGGTNFMASYLKHGAGAITFVQGAGRTLTQVDATAILNGVVGSTATISSVGTKDYLRISNAV
jgi:hypothetical protein